MRNNSYKFILKTVLWAAIATIGFAGCSDPSPSEMEFDLCAGKCDSASNVEMPDWERANRVHVGFWINGGADGWSWHYIDRMADETFNVLHYFHVRRSNGILVGEYEQRATHVSCSNLVEDGVFRAIVCGDIELQIPAKMSSAAPFTVLVEDQLSYSQGCSLERRDFDSLSEWRNRREICRTKIDGQLRGVAQQSCDARGYSGCTLSTEITFREQLRQLGAAKDMMIGEIEFECTDDAQVCAVEL